MRRPLKLKLHTCSQYKANEWLSTELSPEEKQHSVHLSRSLEIRHLAKKHLYCLEMQMAVFLSKQGLVYCLVWQHMCLSASTSSKRQVRLSEGVVMGRGITSKGS